MDLGFTDHVVDGVPVLALAGDADLSTLPRLLQRVDRFAAEHHGQRALIDLDGLGGMEAVAIGVLVGARLRLRAGGGELELVCTNPAIIPLFVRSGLDAAFTLHPSISAAMSSPADPGSAASAPLRQPEPPR